MRRLIALAAVLAAVQLSAGCRHVGGACDCENVNGQHGGCGCGGGGGKPSDANPTNCGYYNGSYSLGTCAQTPPPPPAAPAPGVVRSTVYQPAPQ
jgi:hypothetical protein